MRRNIPKYQFSLCFFAKKYRIQYLLSLQLSRISILVFISRIFESVELAGWVLYAIYSKSCTKKNQIINYKSNGEYSNKRLHITFPACFLIPISFSNLNLNCYNLLDLRNLQEQDKRAFCYHELFWPFTVRINCSSDLNILQILGFQPRSSKVFLDL